MIIINEVKYEPMHGWNLDREESFNVARRKRAQEINLNGLTTGSGAKHDGSTVHIDMAMNKKGYFDRLHSEKELDRIVKIKRAMRRSEFNIRKDPSYIKKLKTMVKENPNVENKKNLYFATHNTIESLPFKKRRKMNAVTQLSNMITNGNHSVDAAKNRKAFFSSDNNPVMNRRKISTLIKGNGEKLSWKDTMRRYSNKIEGNASAPKILK